MNKENENIKLVPELRFPEFEKDGNWKSKTIEDNIDLFSGIALKSKELTNDNAGTPILRGINITEGKIRHSQEMDKFYLGDTSEMDKYLVEENDIVIGMDGSKVGKNVALISKKDAGSILIQRVARIRAVDSEIEYLYQCFLSKQFRNYVDKVNTSSGIPHISSKQIKNYTIGFPPRIFEQQKIAATLTSLDTLISSEKEKLEALQVHKKGLLQQLFPVNGEKVPKLRFGEFSGEWEEDRISKICEKPFSGGTPRSSNENYYGGGIPFIRSAEIDKDRTELFLTQLGYDNSSAKMVKKGDVLIALYGANSGDVAISKIKGAINQAILCLRSKTNNEFLYQYLTHKQGWIISTYLQGGQGNLSGDIIKSVELYFPKDKAEEEKIANCLSSLDNLIATQSQKIESLLEHKKGLMQQMFPNL